MSDIVYIVSGLAVFVFATAALDLTIGRRLARRSRALAVILCGLAIPVLATGAACISYFLAEDRPGDGPVTALAGTLIYVALATPLTLLVSVLTIGRSARSDG